MIHDHMTLLHLAITASQFGEWATAWLKVLTDLFIPLTAFAGVVFGFFYLIRSKLTELTGRVDRQSDRIDSQQQQLHEVALQTPTIVTLPPVETGPKKVEVVNTSANPVPVEEDHK